MLGEVGERVEGEGEREREREYSSVILKLLHFKVAFPCD